MSKTDSRVALSGAQGDANGLGLGCGAPELKQLLNAIADQISDADKRHSDALHDMQHRLTVLGAEAKVVREALPADMAPAIDRIETSMAELSDKLAAAGEPRPPVFDHSVFDVPVIEHPALALASEPPAALRSALAVGATDSGSFTRRDEVSRSAVKPEVDRFDVVSFDGQVQDDEPWDPASAEALTRLYETAGLEPIEPHVNEPGMTETEQAGAAGDHRSVHDHRHDQHHETPAQAPASLQLAVGNDNHAWLEQRFADIANKLDRSLAGLHPDSSVSELNSRFDRFEQQLVDALAEAPRRADLAGIGAIEAQVEDLTRRLGEVQDHFVRLDSIEQELRGLSERIGDASAGAAHAADAGQLPRIETAIQLISERLAESRQAEAQAGAAPALDTEAMARRLAAHLAEQMPASSGSAADTPRIDELRSLLTEFMSERRHGEEQTTTMLDTMQQAMIRLLDRMDAIESGAAGRAHGFGPELEPFSAAELPHQQRHPSPEVDRREQHAEGAHAFGHRAAALHAEAEEAAVAAVAAELHAPEEHAIEPRLQMPAASSELVAETSADDNVLPAPAPRKGSPKVVSREDFVAAARRAARQAAQAPREPAEADDEDSTGPAPAAAAPAKKRAAAAAVGTKSRSPSLMTVGLICTVLAGATFMVAKPYVMSTLHPQPTVIHVPAKPATPAPKALDSGDGEEIIDNAPAAPAAPDDPHKRSSLDAPAGAFDGASRTAMAAGSLVDQNGLFARQPEPQFGSFASQVPATPAALSPVVGEEAATGQGGPDMPPAMIGPNSLRSAAAKGDPSAQFEIGARFAEGKGVVQDLKQAVAWYQRAASQGFAPAQYRLASMYERGLGTKTDLPKAAVWYQRAAEQGVVKAMHNLAVISAGQEAGAGDYANALRWFSAASDYGLTDSQFNLAIMFETGLGVAADPKQAYKWFALAARAGDAEASKRRDVVKAKLSATDLKSVDAEIETWHAKVTEASVNDARLAGEAWKKRNP